MKILIVDDHLMFAQAMRTLLTGEDDVESVSVAGSAEDALRQCGDECPDVVLMDVDLPGENGIAATRDVLRTCPSAEIVIITALQDPHLIARAVEAGAAGFVSKTRAADELTGMIRAAAAGEMVLPEEQAGEILRQLQSSRRRSVVEGPEAQLSERELEVLQAFADGLTTEQVAAHLFISERTVQSHIRSVLSKLDLHSKLQAVLWALRQGLIRLRPIE
ncbi:MAG TPA: response regulator transcription factor [Actinomycetota bacterium]